MNDRLNGGQAPPRIGRATGAGVIAGTSAAMIAFAGNSLLSRAAFQTTSIDAASFTAVRLGAGAITLVAILVYQGAKPRFQGTTLLSSLMLFAYAVTFSYAYRSISTGAGALILFASAQLLMIVYGYTRGERSSLPGVALALGGLSAFLVPAMNGTLPLAAVTLMLASGVAWGSYSIIGRGSESPVASTAGSFLMTVPLCVVMLAISHKSLQIDLPGAIYAGLSGSLASAVGYTIWYWVRTRITAINAGSVQLSVPIISAGMGATLLGEKITLYSALAALVTLLGVLWVSLASRDGK